MSILDVNDRSITAAATPEAERWSGWNTRLKPSAEMWIVVRNPGSTAEFAHVIGNHLYALEAACSRDTSSKADTSRSPLVENTSLSIVRSWLSIWADLCDLMSTCTTETVASLTTVLRTLSFSLSRITQESTTEGQTQANGSPSPADIAQRLFGALSAWCAFTRTFSALARAGETAVSNADLASQSPQVGPDERMAPGIEQFILVRNPLDGTTVENVIRHGAGALNVDACRVARDWSERGEAWARSGHSAKPDAEKIGGHPPGNGIPCNPCGGYPSNVVITHHPGCEPGATCHEDCWVRRIDEQGGERTSGSRRAGVRKGIGYGSGAKGDGGPAYVASVGGASRFFNCFYHPKASRSDRNDGLYDGSDNQHETVKATGLMEHFVSLVTPTSKQVPGGGIVLDITCGSGPTGVAAMNSGMRFIGAELQPDKAELARKRIVGAIFGGPLALVGGSP